MSRLVPELYDLIKGWETCMLTAYKDRDDTWHIGYGYGNSAGLPYVVTPTSVLKDEAEAMALLHLWLEDLEPRIYKIIPRADLLNDNQFSAIVDVAYNRGPGTLRDSALAHHVNKALDMLAAAGNADEEKKARRTLKIAAKYFVLYDESANFKPLDWSNNRETGELERIDGLTLRRIADGGLYLKPA